MNLPRFAVPIALAALCASFAHPAPVRAQAAVEAGATTTETAERPDWARGDDAAPATRFIRGAGIASGAWFRAIGSEAGAFSGLLGGRSSTSATQDVPPPPRKARPKSLAPGSVKGTVQESVSRRPVAGVIVRLISTESQYVTERLEARTDSSGGYEFPRVEPGVWALAVAGDHLSTRYAPPRATRTLTIAKRDAISAPPFELKRTACINGHAGWSDGYVLYDAPLTIAPYDSSQFSATTLMDGVGDFRLCGAPEDSVMVWMHLRDGRSLGRTSRLANGSPRSVKFAPDPTEKMQGSLLRVLPVLNDGTPVPRALITAVGRRFEQGDRPALVFVREQTADAEGVAEFKVPFGVYEVLAINPREGQSGRVQRMIVNVDQEGAQPLRIELRGTSTPTERKRSETRTPRAQSHRGVSFAADYLLGSISIFSPDTVTRATIPALRS
jgi:hypothetical protein